MAPEEYKESQFNEAALKMRRIHEAQNDINNVRLRPFVYNKDFYAYGFEIIHSRLKTLHQEAYSKLEPKEDDELERLFGITETEMVNLFKIDVSNWKYQNAIKNKIIKNLFIVEKSIRKVLEDHGYGSPNKEQEAGWD